MRRVQALIAQEPSTAKNKKRKSKVSVASAEPDNSSKELSDEGSEEAENQSVLVGDSRPSKYIRRSIGPSSR